MTLPVIAPGVTGVHSDFRRQAGLIDFNDFQPSGGIPGRLAWFGFSVRHSPDKTQSPRGWERSRSLGDS